MVWMCGGVRGDGGPVVVWVCGGVCVVMVDQWWYGCVEVCVW